MRRSKPLPECLQPPLTPPRELASSREPRALGRKGGRCGVPSPCPSAASHHSHHRGELASSREPRALGRASVPAEDQNVTVQQL